MKHLKKYNETNAFTHDPDMELIKDIILELKHEYSNLEGVIVNRNGSNGDVYTVIELSALPILNENCIKIKNIDKRMKYFNLIIECAKRLEEALNRKVVIENLFHESLGRAQEETINIMIDDIKNKGKMWK